MSDFGIFLPDAKIISSTTMTNMFLRLADLNKYKVYFLVSPFPPWARPTIFEEDLKNILPISYPHKISFQVIYCETQILTDQKLTSSTFPCCVLVCPSKSVTSPLLDHTNHTFLESLWLTHHPTQTHQAHHMAFWVSHSLLLSSFTNNLIILLDRGWTFNPPKCKPPFLSSICVSTLLAPFLSGQ